MTELCHIAGVSRSGYYAWLQAEPARQTREAQDQADFQLILTACRFRGYDKGVRGIHMRLLHTGVRMNSKKIRRLMKKYNISCPIRKANPYRRLQRTIRSDNTADDLVKREFEDMVLGNLSRERYQKMLESYEAEQADLNNEIIGLDDWVATREEMGDNVDQFLALLEKYVDIPELTPAIVNEFIKQIIVYAPEKVNGKRT